MDFQSRLISLTAKFLVCLFWVLIPVKAQAQKIATSSAYCLSVNLTHASASVGGYSLDSYFTTFDGSAGIPLVDRLGGYLYFSGELSPDTTQSGLYRSDYVVYVNNNLDSYGTTQTRFPTTDSDGNSVPDFLQMEKSGTVDFSGTAETQFPSVSSSTIIGRITRSAGSPVGSYSATVKSLSGSQTAVYSGTSYLINAFGQFAYTRGDQNTGSFQLSLTDELGRRVTYQASSQFNVNSRDQISFPEIKFYGSDNLVFTAKPFSMARSGRTYRGNLELLDGGHSTSWRDYTQWRIEVSDPNDSDQNGVPDLSDTATEAPKIITQPETQTVVEGGTVVLKVVAKGTPPLSFQWRKNGTNIPFATGDTYTLSGVQVGASGRYSVLVSNAAGSAVSNDGELIVIQPILAPSVIVAPQSQSVASGTSAMFSVTVGGTPPFAYQWRKNGQDLPGATKSNLNLSGVQSSDAGDYSVTIFNSAGQVTTASATLRVQTASSLPVILTQPLDLTAETPNAVTFSVVAAGTLPMSYVWKKAGVAIPGKNEPTLTILATRIEDAGDYSVTISNAAGTVTSRIATLVVVPPKAGFRINKLSLPSDGAVSLVIAASIGQAIVVQRSGDLKSWADVDNFQANSENTERKLAKSVEAGAFFRLKLADTGGAMPTIIRQPSSVTVGRGNRVTLRVQAEGPEPITYQWRKDGVSLTGANGASYAIVSAQVSDSGIYTVLVSNQAGTVTSEPAELLVRGTN